MITKVLDGQNVYDLALQIYGTVDGEAVTAICEGSEIPSPTAATKISDTVEHTETKNAVTLTYKKQNVKPSNSIFTEEETNGGFSGDYSAPGYTKDYTI